MTGVEKGFSNVLAPWVLDLVADPVTKERVTVERFPTQNGVIDARVFLRNTSGFAEWETGQISYEAREETSQDYNSKVDAYRKEIERDRVVYQHIRMSGRILDVGGGAGTVREFLDSGADFVSVDPFISWHKRIPPAKVEAYSCLQQDLNFIAACAEFLPFLPESFDWVHMRSMVDHVQVPDLVILEGKRVLKPNGRLVVGLYVSGGKTGRKSMREFGVGTIKQTLSSVGLEQFKDHHMFHPTYDQLFKLIQDNGFKVEDTYWQPGWNDTVCFLTARKS